MAGPIETIAGKTALAATFAGLFSRYDATTYLNGQSMLSIDGGQATGETDCLAHHFLHEDDQRMLVTMAIRYLDTFERGPTGWVIRRRDLVFDWTDRRGSEPAS